MNAAKVFLVSSAEHQQTLAAALRQWFPGQSWSQVRQLVAARRIRLNGELWLDPVRRLKEGDTVEVLPRSAPQERLDEKVVIRHLDEDLVVVEKPAGICTVRHPAERDWPARRRQLVPTLEDLVQLEISQAEGRSSKKPPRLRIVQRLDKETSGLVVFARSVAAERGLGRQFHRHTVTRRYLAIVPGYLPAQTIKSQLVRDRGDGRRGSTTLPGLGKEAITHIDVVERLPAHTLLSCRLETGRTHQIRIHLAERGHPICGEKVYQRQSSDHKKDAPRLALHAAELGFVHPHSGQQMHWTMPLPPDLQIFLDRLRGQK